MLTKGNHILTEIASLKRRKEAAESKFIKGVSCYVINGQNQWRFSDKPEIGIPTIKGLHKQLSNLEQPPVVSCPLKTCCFKTSFVYFFVSLLRCDFRL